MTIVKITRAYVRHYTDNNQTVAYVEWIDHRGVPGRTEGAFKPPMASGCGLHMLALFARARREGITKERW